MKTKFDLLYEKLQKVMKIEIDKTYRKYQRTPLGTILNKETITAIAQDIIIDMSKKELDEVGVYNYFRASFKNKIIDETKKYVNTKKRSLTEDLLENDEGTSQVINLNETKNLFEFYAEELNKKNKELFNIFSLILSGYNNNEIMEKLNISKSTFDKYKEKIHEIILKHNIPWEIEFDIKYIVKPKIKLEHHLVKHMKKNSFDLILCLVIKKIDGKKEVLLENKKIIVLKDQPLNDYNDVFIENFKKSIELNDYVDLNTFEEAS